jgi:nicotinate-nucleotide adenylyltransferase
MPSMTCRVLFGGSFDPPQRAHRELAERALAARPRCELVVIPAGRPPHKEGRSISPGALRKELCELAFAGLPRTRISDEELRREGRSFTVDTVRRHRDELGPDASLYWLLGSDSLLELDSWRNVHEILRLCEVLTVPRPGFDVADLDELDGLDASEKRALREGVLGHAAAPAISSTEVRRRIAAGEACAELIRPAVARRVAELGLYR